MDKVNRTYKELEFNFRFVKGWLYKKIDNKKFYHATDFHKKFLLFDFDKDELQISDGEFKKPSVIYNFKEIQRVSVENS